MSRTIKISSTENKQLIMLVHRIPYPPNKGDKIRSFNQIKYLAEKGWDIHLCTHVDEPDDLRYKTELERYCKTVTIELIPKFQRKVIAVLKSITGTPLTVSYFYSITIQKKVDELLDTYPIQTVFCFSSPMAEYVIRAKSINGKKPRLIMDLIDVDSLKWKQYAEEKKSLSSFIYWLESKLLSRYESMIVNNFNAVTLVSYD